MMKFELFGITVGMAIGLTLGVAIGIAAHSLPMGVGIGLAVGGGVGVAFEEVSRRRASRSRLSGRRAEANNRD
jgi:hypothetical protein